MSTVQTLSLNLTESQVKALKDAVDEINVSMSRIESENEQIKDIVDAAFDLVKVPKKIIKRLAKAKYQNSLQEETAEFNDFVKLFDAITN
jgi:TRAP-type mannitol/chloroaromatic compound transport system substrate-binding protein